MLGKRQRIAGSTSTRDGGKMQLEALPATDRTVWRGGGTGSTHACNPASGLEGA